MTGSTGIDILRWEMEKGIGLAKCQKCGCMHETLDTLASLLDRSETELGMALKLDVANWNRQIKPVEYACLGCAYCYPAAAQNAFAQAFPELDSAPALACGFQVRAAWPPVAGEYYVVDTEGYIAISTLGSPDLARDLAGARLAGVAIVGKTETENIGVDKIVKNTIANPGIQYLVVAGKETSGHQSGKTLLALAANGVDANGRVTGSPGKRPTLRNVTFSEVETFRAQVQAIDLIGCEDPAEIQGLIETLSRRQPEPCG